jgi:hypothetical protein
MIGKRLEKEFRGIVGNRNYMDSPEHLINYSYDGFVTESKPEVVFFAAKHRAGLLNHEDSVPGEDSGDSAWGWHQP